MKRCVVILISLVMLAAICLCSFGESLFYTKYSGNYLVLLPNNKTNNDLASALGGSVYTDYALTLKASGESVVGTGKFINVSGKKYEIIVRGDYDGDGFVLNSDINRARASIGKSLSQREMFIFDADENNKYTARDYLLLKFHNLGIKKFSETYQRPIQPESSEEISSSLSHEVSVESSDVSEEISENVSEDLSEEASEEVSEETSVDPDWVNQCSISLSDDKINIDGSGATVSGKTVNITQGGEYTVSGKITDGMIKVNSTAKVKIRLSGADISNSKGPAILFANADKAFITIANGTVNYLSDGTSYSDGKGTIFSEVDLEIKGKGTLYLTANYRHGICCDNDLAIENGTIIVEKAVKDGIHSKKSLEISGGTIIIKNCEGDAIDCEGTSSGLKGTVTITGGAVIIENTAGDGINALGNVALSGGNISITCEQDGIKTDAYAYIAGKASLVVNAGSDGVNAVKGINVSSGTATISAVDYTLKSDSNIYVIGGSLTLEGVMEKIYALGNVNIANGTVK